MAGEITGSGVTITCKPKLSTNNQAVWESRIKDGTWFVVLDGATTTADEVGVAFGATNAAEFVGRLVGSTGDGSSFRVSIETQGKIGYAEGGDTGAFASTDFGKFMKLNGSGKLIVDTALTAGNVIVVGGDKADPMVAWAWPVNK